MEFQAFGESTDDHTTNQREASTDLRLTIEDTARMGARIKVVGVGGGHVIDQQPGRFEPRVEAAPVPVQPDQGVLHKEGHLVGPAEPRLLLKRHRCHLGGASHKSQETEQGGTD